MRALYLDCFAGISGNMFLGAMLQAGVPQGYLENELQKLPWRQNFPCRYHLIYGRHTDFMAKASSVYNFSGYLIRHTKHSGCILHFSVYNTVTDS